MKKVFSIILLLTIIFASSNTATALQPLNYTNIFPQGQYLVSEKNGKLKPGKYEFSLITPNVVSYVYIIDKIILRDFLRDLILKILKVKEKRMFLYLQQELY